MENCEYYTPIRECMRTKTDPPARCLCMARVKSVADSVTLCCPCKYFKDKRQITFEDLKIYQAKDFNAEKYIVE